MSPNPGADVVLEVLDSWSDVPRDGWDALVDGSSPVVTWTYLHALEASGAACHTTGWHPRPVVARDPRGRIVGGLPVWRVDHADGQFVWDEPWRRAIADAGLRYFPKALVGVPFNPVVGPRRLGVFRDDPALVDRALALAVPEAPGHHLHFAPVDEVLRLSPRWFRRRQVQYHWHRDGERDFEGFLARFRSARRKSIRRERRALHGWQIRVEDRPDPALAPLAHATYAATCERYGAPVRLPAAWFERLMTDAATHVRLVVARHGGEDLATALLLAQGDRLYGRTWGSLVDAPFLHFEVCYYTPIAWALAHGVNHFDPGHGGEHKFRRGFEVVRTWSAHAFAHPGVHASFRRWAGREASWFDEREAELGSPFRSY